MAPTWHALQSAREAGEEDELPPPEAHGHALLVHRAGLRTQWQSLQADEAEALRELLAADSLAAWLEQQGAARLPQVVALLQGWVQSLSTV